MKSIHMAYIQLLVVSVLCVSMLDATSLARAKRNTPTSQTGSELEYAKYLQNFGYIKEDVKLDKLPKTELDGLVSNAVKEFQNFHGLSETGVIDSDTKAEMEQPRCSNVDDDELQLILKQNGDKGDKGYDELRSVRLAWDKSDFPLTYSVDSIPRNLDSTKVIKAIREAVDEWDRNSGVSMVQVPSGGRLRLTFEAIDKQWNVLGRGYYPKHGKVIFDSLENWLLDDTNSGRGVNMKKVAIHELGHALGLTHSDKRNTIMYPNYSHKQGMSLAFDDIKAVQNLYGENTATAPTRSSVPRRTITKPTTTTTSTTAATAKTSTSRKTILRRRMRNEREKIENRLKRLFGGSWGLIPKLSLRNGRITVISSERNNNNGKVRVVNTVMTNDKSIKTTADANAAVADTESDTESETEPDADTDATTSTSRTASFNPFASSSSSIVTEILDLSRVSNSERWTGSMTSLPVERFMLIGKIGGAAMIDTKPNRAMSSSESLLWSSKSVIENSASSELKNPVKLTLAGNSVIIADKARNCILKLDSSGFTELAGQCDRSGDEDDSLTEALFNEPADLCKDRRGNLLVLDQGNNKIRYVSVDYKQTYTKVRLPTSSKFEAVTCKSGNMYLSANSQSSAKIYRINLSRSVWTIQRILSIPKGQGRDGSISDSARSFGNFGSVVYNNGVILIDDDGALREYNIRRGTLSTVCSKSSSFRDGRAGSCRVSNLIGLDRVNDLVYGFDGEANKLVEVHSTRSFF